MRDEFQNWQYSCLRTIAHQDCSKNGKYPTMKVERHVCFIAADLLERRFARLEGGSDGTSHPKTQTQA